MSQLYKIRLFAAAKQAANADTISVTLESTTSVGELKTHIGEQCEALKPLLSHCLIAVNEDYAADDLAIPEGADIAVIPPVSGG